MEESKARLLIVDDMPAGLQVLQILLMDEPYDVLVATSAREALDNLCDLRPDLILMDVLMPGLDGFEACRRLRETPGFAEIPIFLITALDDTASRMKGIASGADDFISKPFNSNELRNRIRGILRMNRFGRLRAERERYARLFSAIPDSVFILGRTGTILAANPSAARLLEVPFAHRATGLELTPRLDEPSQAMLQYLLSAIGTADPHPGSAELKIVTASRGTRTLELTHAPLEWGSVPALQVIARDVTEARELAEQYRQAQKMETVGQLTAGIAHDFSNVLSIINMYSAFLLTTVQEGDPHRRGIQAIADAGERATQLAAQVLYFSRKQPLTPRPLDLNALLTNLEPLLNRLVGESVKLHLDLAFVVDSILADASQIEQVILNLAANARDALPSGGRLSLSTASDPVDPGDAGPRFVTLRVLDTGCGMEEETRRRIFEPFFTTKGEGGTGLGLTNVQRIVKEHHGYLRIESQPGQGTEVTVYLPVATTESTARPAPENAPHLILLLWPDSLERAYLVDVLEGHGYHTIVTPDPGTASALAREESERLSLLITDAEVPPDIDGLTPAIILDPSQAISPGDLLRTVGAALLQRPVVA